MGNWNWDIFISYAHIDNQHYSDVPQGWVDYLQERLEIRLAQLLGHTPHIWRDRKKLRGNLDFQNEIDDDLTKVAVFVSILSPRYLESASCQAEITAFTQAAAQQGGIRRGNTHRVFKVIKTEVPREAHPAEWQSLLGYEFYEKDLITGRVREFDHLLIGNHRDKRYWDKLEDLADDIAKTLLPLQHATIPPSGRGLLDLPPQASPDSERISGSSGITVYLAETTSDLAAERDILRRELQQRGHRVVPDQTLPLTAPALEQAGRQYLQQAILSVHLLGAHYGVVPEMERSRSNVHLQLNLTDERCGQPNFARLLWIPPGLQPADERQQQLIDTVQRTPMVGSELLQTKLEDLKNHIHTKLAPSPPIVTNGHQEQTARKVYLVYDERDYEEARTLEDFLIDHGFELIQPPLGSEDTQSMQQYHIENLKLCDAVLIYHGQAPSMWAQVKLQDLIKLPGLGRSQPLLAKALYLGAPQNDLKEKLRARDVLLIKGYQGFNAEILESFLSHLKQGPRAGS